MMHGHREVGPRHSSCEAGEQSEEIHCGGVCREGRSGAGGAKGGDQGKCGPAKHVPGAEPDKRVTGAGTHTAICRHTPEVGAVCGKAARTVLCGGRAMKRTSLPLQRREFITLLGSAAAWPLAASAQQPAIPVIGFLSARSPEDSAHLINAFHRGLAEGGFVEGQNVAIEYRWARGQYDRLPAMAADLVSRRVNVLTTAGGEPAALAAKHATSTIPIVFGLGSDPMTVGLVESFNRPGGNATGMTFFTTLMDPKRFGLLRDLVPGVRLIGVLLNPSFPPAQQQLQDIENAAKSVN